MCIFHVVYQYICMHANAHVCNCVKASCICNFQLFPQCVFRISWGDFCCSLFLLQQSQDVLFLLSTLCEVKKLEQLLSIGFIWDIDMSHSFTGKCVNLELCLPAQSLLFETLAKTSASLFRRPGFVQHCCSERELILEAYLID